jgi:hypothetical protein
MADYEIDLTASTTEVVEVQTSGYEVNLDVVPALTVFEIETATPPAELVLDVGTLDYSIDLEYGFQGDTHTHFPVTKTLNYTNGKLSTVVSSTGTLTLAYNISGKLETVTSADWTKTLTFNPDGTLAAVTVT